VRGIAFSTEKKQDPRAPPQLFRLASVERLPLAECAGYADGMASMQVCLICCLLGIATAVFADDAAIDFVRDVQPILAARCCACHGPNAQEGGLRLDLRSRALAGGDSGKAIELRDSAKSPLVQRISSDDSDRRMPPKGERLTREQISVLQRWIEAGAPWPDSAAGNTNNGHWSFQPIRRPLGPPGNADHPLDAFIVERLSRESITPSPEADRTTLIRRLNLDLLGLLPDDEQVTTFVEDQHPLA
jgi:mono/diheme cytochrome c family protein